MLPFPSHSINARRGPPAIYGTEFSRNWGTDFATIETMPSGSGFLFSAWTRIPEQLPPDVQSQRGNFNVFEFQSPTWGCVCIGGNGGWNPDNQNCFYNANTMFGPINPAHLGGTYLGYDQTWYLQEWLPLSYINNWVFLAWQVIINASDVTIRQWIKFQGQPMLNPQESILTFAQMRADLVVAGWTQGEADAWTPGLATSTRFGTNAGMLIHARAESNSTLPSQPYMESIAALSGPDASAWADWSLEYTNQVNLSDRSGNGRNLTPNAGAAFYRGPTFP
jgi:hypothetical protein